MEPTNDLDTLAAQIEAEHQAGGTAGTEMVNHWKRAGDLAREARERVERELGYGHWGSWLKQHFRSPRSIRRYMRISENWSKVAPLSLEQIGHGVANLSLRELERITAGPERPRNPPPFELRPDCAQPSAPGAQLLATALLDAQVRDLVQELLGLTKLPARATPEAVAELEAAVAILKTMALYTVTTDRSDPSSRVA